MPIVYTRKRLRAPPPAPSPQQRAPPSPPPPAPKAKKRRYTQLFIDAGQKDFIKTCATCSMLYAPGRDDAVHARYHRATRLPRWSPRTPGTFVGSVEDVRIYLLKTRAEKTARRVDAFVSGVLGTALEFPTGGWVAVVAVVKGVVRGFCLAERIKKARLLDGGVVRGEEDAVMGVRKIWVDVQFRGKGIATRLVDEACLALVYGPVVERRFVAFSVPTADGTKFAKRFGNGRVLVYDTADVDRRQI